MPKQKLKTNRSAAKRIRSTGTGKLKRQQAGKRHLLSVKNAARKRNLGGWVPVASENTTSMKRLLPYGCR